MGQMMRIAGGVCLFLVWYCGRLAGEDPEAHSDLCLQISTGGKTSYLVAEPIVIVASARNTGTRTLKGIVSLGGGWANARYLTFTFASPLNPNLEMPKYRPGGPEADRRTECGDRIDLGPVQETKGQFFVTWYAAVKKCGRYEITAEYFPNGSTGAGDSSHCKSNTLVIDVQQPEGEDLDAAGLLAGKDFPEGQIGWSSRGQMLPSDNSLRDVEAIYLRLLQDHPRSAYAKYVSFFLGDAYARRGDRTKAMPLLLAVTKGEVGLLADDALIRLAECQIGENLVGDADLTLADLEGRFPDSENIALAKSMREKLRKTGK